LKELKSAVWALVREAMETPLPVEADTVDPDELLKL
jgi:hypothetical protein